MDFNAAIFDLDGTILDSMNVWEHIDIQFLKKRNLPVPENYVTEICARSFEEAAQYTIDLFGLQETVEGIIEEWNNMAVEEYSNHVGLLPHALDYLLRLKEHGIKLAVATGLPEKLYMPCLKNNSILELFDALCSTDEVQRGKEYSDVFELAARKLGVAPEHCIVFDDVLPAIKSAKAARMLAGGIYDKYSADQRTEIERIADIYLLDFRQAPIPQRGMKMEKWDLYNAKREKSGITVCRGEIIPKGLYHLSVSVWIVNQQGQYLLSQRHPKKQYPLYWECTGGSVLSGETSLQGAIREVKEELGILLTPGSEKLIYQTRRENVQDFYDVWLFHKDIKIEEMHLQETEVVDVQWVSPDKLFEMFCLKQLHPLLTYVEELIG